MFSTSAFSECFYERLKGLFDYTYVFHNGQQVAQVKPDGTKEFIHGDHIGSSSVVTDESGNVIENTTYEPFGSIVSGGDTTRFDYENKEFDSDLGTYDFHFRQYKPEWGLFTQPDTLIQNVYDPQSLNRYMFERGNPYGYTDPDGHYALAIAGFIGLMALAGGGQELAVQLINTGRVYNWGKVGYSALESGVVGAAAVGALFIPYAGLVISGGILLAYEHYSWKSLKDTIEEAQSYGKIIETPEGIPIPDTKLPEISNEANSQQSVNPPIRDSSNMVNFVATTQKQKISSGKVGGTDINVFKPARDADGKTKWDRIIEKNKENKKGKS